MTSSATPTNGPDTGDPELRVEFCGEEYSATSDRTLTIGRSADIVIDDNRFLHRILAEFRYANGLWWIDNVGSSIGLALNDDASTSSARIAPGTSTPIAYDSATLRFDAGGTSYELALDVIGLDASEDESDHRVVPDPTTDPDDRTATTSHIPITDDQHRLLVALAVPVVRDQSMPTNRLIAASLDWTVTKFNRKLDGLCAKYSKAGVAGLHGSSDRLAKDRRTRLAEHVVEAGIVSPQDVEDHDS
ncbi:MAG: FHA domain-containing protein [Ilumatobacter sp.]